MNIEGDAAQRAHRELCDNFPNDTEFDLGMRVANHEWKAIAILLENLGRFLPPEELPDAMICFARLIHPGKDAELN